MHSLSLLSGLPNEHIANVTNILEDEKLQLLFIPTIHNPTTTYENHDASEGTGGKYTMESVSYTNNSQGTSFTSI